MKINSVVFALLMIFSMSAHAGFVTGVIVGSSISSDKAKQVARNQAAPVVIKSDHDTIACLSVDGYRCRISYGDDISIAEFISRAGYSRIIGRAVQLQGGSQYILLEVAK